MTDWREDGQAAHQQQLEMQLNLERIIVKATHEKITQDEAATLAWAAGVNFQQQEAA